MSKLFRILFTTNTLCPFRLRTDHKCPARLIRKRDENNEYVYIVKQAHSHMLDPRDIEVQNMKKNLKEIAATSRQPTRAVVAQAQAGLSEYALVQSPEYDSLANSVRIERNGGEHSKPPTSLHDLTLPDELRRTASGEPIVMYDSDIYEDEKRLMIFSTHKNLEFLATCETIHMDGTFKTCPQLFTQLFVIHGMLYTVVF